MELKRCPFCGSRMILTYHSRDNTFNFWHKDINDCAAVEPIKFDGDIVESLKEAEEAWNMRATDG